MSQQEFESYLRLLARFLHLNGAQREAIARELRAHMEDRLEDLLARGYTREEAIQTALDEFGDAAALAGEFGRIGRRRRWIMRTTTATISIAAAVLLVSFLLPEHKAWLPAPSPTHAGQGDEPKNAEPFPVLVPSAGTAESVPPTEPAADRRTRERLGLIMPVVDLAEGTSFADAVEFLRVQSKSSFSVNWAALGFIGVERTTDTGGLKLSDVKVETVLDLLLDNVTQAGGGAGRVSYDIVDGVLRVSSADDLNRRVVLRVYDCRDLLGVPLTAAQKETLDIFAARLTREHRPATRPASATTTQPASANRVAKTGSSGRDSSNVDPLVAELLGELRHRDADYLIEVISAMIEPGSWEPEGTQGSMREYDGFLVVRHTASVQRQIDDLLRAIREARANRTRVSGVSAVVSP
jgi:hypothetical protein